MTSDVHQKAAKEQAVGEPAHVNQFLTRLCAESLARLTPHLELVAVSTGQISQEAARPQKYAFFPTTSIVALVHVGQNGESSLVGTIGQDGLIGIVQILGDGTSPQRAVVQTPGQAWRIKTAHLKNEFARAGTLMQHTLRYAQYLMTHAAQLAVCNRHHVLSQQLSRWMLVTLDRLPTNHIHCTQERVSAMLGVRRQGVSEAAAALEDLGIISRKRGRIEILHRPRLEQMVCECYGVIKDEQDRLFAQPLPAALAITDTPSGSADTSAGDLAVRAQRFELALLGSDLAWFELYLHTQTPLVQRSAQWDAMLGRAAPEGNPLTIADWNAGVHPDDLAARDQALQAHIQGQTPMFECEYRERHASGHWLWMAARGKVVHQAHPAEPLRMVGTLMEITERKDCELRLITAANTDFLTGASSRRHFFEVAEHEFARSKRHALPLSLLALDVDNFKEINEQHGHAGGDQVLKELVNSVRKLLRMTDAFGRIGGDEFCVLLPNTGQDSAAILAERILHGVREQPASLGQLTIAYSVSIGVCQAQPHTPSFDSLMESADKALYLAKKSGMGQLGRSS